jgi:hypothetical protein
VAAVVLPAQVLQEQPQQLQVERAEQGLICQHLLAVHQHQAIVQQAAAAAVR